MAAAGCNAQYQAAASAVFLVLLALSSALYLAACSPSSSSSSRAAAATKATLEKLVGIMTSDGKKSRAKRQLLDAMHIRKQQLAQGKITAGVLDQVHHNPDACAWCVQLFCEDATGFMAAGCWVSVFKQYVHSGGSSCVALHCTGCPAVQLNDLSSSWSSILQALLGLRPRLGRQQQGWLETNGSWQD